jgi:membrane protease YdiL (CAAX protease family)
LFEGGRRPHPITLPTRPNPKPHQPIVVLTTFVQLRVTKAVPIAQSHHAIWFRVISISLGSGAIFKLYRFGIASSTSRMAFRGKYILPVFLLVLFLGAMILGPLIYFGMQVIWPIPFHRAMARGLLISALAAIALVAPQLPLAKLWPWNGDAWKQVLLGFVMAAVSIQAILGLYLATAGFTSSHLSAGTAVGRVLLAVVAAVLLPPLEETLFRGFLQRELVRGIGWRAGWILAAAIFALAHFLKVPVDLDKQPVHLWSGVPAMGAAFTNLGQTLAEEQNAGKAVNLFLIGLILGGIFLRSGNLWVNYGLHGGWILGMLLFTGFAHRTDPPRIAWFGGDILSSLATTLVLLLAGLWLWRFYRHPSVQPEPTPGTGPSAR